MIPLVVCPNGHVFRSRIGMMFGPNVRYSTLNCEEDCPFCGAMSRTPDGVFNFGDEVLKAIRAPGVSKHDVESFYNVTKAVKNGEASVDEAIEDLSRINLTFASFIKVANENPAILGLLFTLLQALLACWAIASSNQGSDQAHLDARAQLEATQAQSNQLNEMKADNQETIRAVKELNSEVQRLNSRQLEIENTVTYASDAVHAPSIKITRQQRRHSERQAKKRAKH